jgi:UDP-N-acetylmuramoyl-tripeptide--D-alanyl-D-alanine ligase
VIGGFEMRNIRRSKGNEKMKVSFGIKPLNISQIAAMCAGSILGNVISECEIVSVCTDSREAEKNSLFLAIRGEKVDGHNYINKAAELGAVCAIAERVPEGGVNIPLIIVNDTVSALASLSSAYAEAYHKNIRKIAVTGSVGKTTAKEMIASVLGVSHKLYRSGGNHNSTIGMPLSQLEIKADTEFAVLEMGMSQAGEISVMSRTAHPDAAVITNIGTSHLEYFDSRAGIASAKLEVVEGLSADGLLLLCAGEPLLSEVGSWDGRVKYYAPDADADIHAENIRTNNGKTLFDAVVGDKKISNIEISAIGKHNVHAALSAIGIGVHFGISESDIRQGLAGYRPVGMRQQIFEVGGVTVINDCYNASPESMRAACEVLCTLAKEKNGNKFALLGDMLELGESSRVLHYSVGAHFGEADVRLFAFGELASEIARGAAEHSAGDRVTYFSEAEREDVGYVASVIAKHLKAGDCILIKASRRMAAERFTAALSDILGK